MRVRHTLESRGITNMQERQQLAAVNKTSVCIYEYMEALGRAESDYCLVTFRGGGTGGGPQGKDKNKLFFGFDPHTHPTECLPH